MKPFSLILPQRGICTHFWIINCWEHAVHVKLQRNSREPHKWFLHWHLLPFWGFFSRQSESLMEKVASWERYWKWGTPGFQPHLTPLNTGWICRIRAQFVEVSVCVFGSLVSGLTSKSNNFWLVFYSSGFASKSTFCHTSVIYFLLWWQFWVVSLSCKHTCCARHPLTESACQPFPGDDHCLNYCLNFNVSQSIFAFSLCFIGVTLN